LLSLKLQVEALAGICVRHLAGGPTLPDLAMSLVRPGLVRARHVGAALAEGAPVDLSEARNVLERAVAELDVRRVDDARLERHRLPQLRVDRRRRVVPQHKVVAAPVRHLVARDGPRQLVHAPVGEAADHAAVVEHNVADRRDDFFDFGQVARPDLKKKVSID
jgi:hypothetical protein